MIDRPKRVPADGSRRTRAARRKGLPQVHTMGPAAPARRLAAWGPAVGLAFMIAGYVLPALRADVSLEQTRHGFAVVNTTQKVTFSRNPDHRFVLATFVRKGPTWVPLFDAGAPILAGTDFDLFGSQVAVVERSAKRVAIRLQGTHDKPPYPWDLLVEARQGSPLLRFRMTCQIPAPWTLHGLEPEAMLWAKRSKPQVVVNQGPGNIYWGHAEKEWGNSFPAAYLWMDGQEAAVFFNMTAATWMGPRNLFRFRDCRVQVATAGGRTGIGLRVVRRHFHQVAAGAMVLEFYLHARSLREEPTRLDALHRLIRAFAPLHPATAPWPVFRRQGDAPSWSFFAAKTTAALMLPEVTWSDRPLPTERPWRDRPLFPERICRRLRVSPDYAVHSSCSPATDRPAAGRHWDFSTCYNYVAPWIAYNRLHPDPGQKRFLQAKLAGLPMFYDPECRMFRHRPRCLGSLADVAMSWQNFTFSLEVSKIYRLLGGDGFQPAIGGRFLMEIDSLIQYAHNVDYVFPQWFDPSKKTPIAQRDVPALGVVFEPWQIGTYAYLMCVAHEMTGRPRYRAEAENAVERLFGGMRFTVANQRYTVTYTDPVDFPITEIFGNAWGVAACQELLNQSGDERWERARGYFLDSLLRMTYWYESALRDDPQDRALANVGLFRNHGGAFTGSPWENVEACLPLTFYLKYARRADTLVLRLLNLQRINAFYFFPPVFPDAAIPCAKLVTHQAACLPIENFYMPEQGGRHGGGGAAVYMSSMALWNYLMFEALAEAADRKVLVVNLDVVDGFEAAFRCIERSFVVYNPTREARKTTVRFKSLRPGDYRLTIARPKGQAEERVLTLKEDRAEVPLALAADEHCRLLLKDVDGKARHVEFERSRTARDRLSAAYARLQLAAMDRAGNNDLDALKKAFLEARKAYQTKEYVRATRGAKAILERLRQTMPKR